ncbi:Nif3-like dinuclear metal center hexameric protein [Vibrio anguillarum]|uniref:Nif3-like dinuclear metal center hexameric protein n=1 Tax=Vibrio anguillarum TaxID=55601 RepID=UPI00097E1F27|nr:Nif3-like dinuclear metal center hexameric protein [Vibrio anguillarum]MBF4283858.1 Nif3-like dinuclear metal center hexameric protein [Vibrio anguillarum]MBF4286989.1 Nif3-like dinuclear metal center hexameric protein [Vibrio anguillarum]MBF4342896.1 Nif3-like dinuclear metal center hexameric protein [Vibrio anguillarum]MBF4357415.1 Nif3-like dinuclear metal center hexameric protein [Vibrio anguillarum]MBF4377645.1 Nif3-like dinuclear metal center hexameric protein [Vibrio anguillarum]
MDNLKLEALLNQKLNPQLIKDYCPNGLQVEGRTEIKKIVTGVTASQALIEQAIERNADALLVHHGYFWKSEPESIRGMKGHRIRALIRNDINLYAYHLPLDIHPELGNNKLLADLLGIHVDGGLEGHPQSVAMFGHFEQALTADELSQRIEQALQRRPLHVVPSSNRIIKTVGWCTGGGQDFVDLAAQHGLDAFISGEISERTTYSAREQNIHYFSAGHHATERYGVKALGEWLASEYGFEVEFIDINNPV